MIDRYRCATCGKLEFESTHLPRTKVEKDATLEHFNRSRHFPEKAENRRADCSSDLFEVQNPLQVVAKKTQAVRSNCVEIETTV